MPKFQIGSNGILSKSVKLRPMRILVFGDSITQGFWDVQGGWVARLRKFYDERQIANLKNRNEPTIFNLGISGDITGGVIRRFENELEARKWRWPNEDFAFVFAIGTNDSANESNNQPNLKNYYKELKELISLARKQSNRILFVELTPVIENLSNNQPGRTKMYTNERIEKFNQVLTKSC